MPQLIIIADDLTGAADTGIAFARSGLHTVVNLYPGPVPNCDVWVISTHSRHLPPAQAQDQVRMALASIQASSTQLPWIYKKIDSTLRGHAGPELQTVMSTLGLDRVLIAPAFPGQERTTREGRQYVAGQLLTDTAFGQEAAHSDVASYFNSLTDSHSLKMLDLPTIRKGQDTLVDCLVQATPTLFIADAETNDDLLRLAKAALASETRLLCGSAGLARGLEVTLKLQPSANQPIVPQRPNGPILIVAGSRHPQTAAQVQRLAQQDTPVIQPTAIGQDVYTSHESQPISQALAMLRQEKQVVISTSGLPKQGLDGQTIASQLGEMVQTILAATPIGGLILTGGDIAMAVCTALQSTAICLDTEIEPGIPSGTLNDGPYAGLPLVTKAGGFGTDEVFLKALDHLDRSN
ncbi:MAG: four-carbon acid sugar kinase family protein [Chloroflexota bacterium]